MPPGQLWRMPPEEEVLQPENMLNGKKSALKKRFWRMYVVGIGPIFLGPSFFVVGQRTWIVTEEIMGKKASNSEFKV